MRLPTRSIFPTGDLNMSDDNAILSFDFDDLPTYLLIIETCFAFDIDPSPSLEMEQFFRELVRSYEGEASASAFQAWLAEQLPKYFVCLGERPRWIQGAAWPVQDGKPMVFIGQIAVSIQDSPVAAQRFHDDTSFYVFLGKHDGLNVVVSQQH